MILTKNERRLDFRTRLKQGDLLIGTFVKTTSHQIIEVLGETALDFVVLDAEHAPFSRESLDVALMAACLADLPALVRVPDIGASQIGMALDLGAGGIVAPHIRSRADADRFSQACRYREGARGFSNSPRAGRYGSTGMNQLLDESDSETITVAQIEDVEALAEIDKISRAGVDCLFIGRADLALSCGCNDINDEQVQRHVEMICTRANEAGMRLAMFVSDPTDIARFAPMGVSVFVIGSDQSLLRAGICAMLSGCMNINHKKP